jgi:single-strand selective monofunctional uracil DNA glycosylase
MLPLIKEARDLAARADALRFGAPVSHVYNPLLYARAAHETYLQRFGATPKEVIFLGMNPGPFGMAQTGVPFGEIAPGQQNLWDNSLGSGSFPKL